jgi:putative FmdB family regulatory protein
LPTYEYQCKSCGRAFETVQAFSDAPLTTCETCGGALKKVYGAVGIVLKGSGFYKTDSRSTASAKKRSSGDATSNGHDAPSSSEPKTGASETTSDSTPSPTPPKQKDTAKTK